MPYSQAMAMLPPIDSFDSCLASIDVMFTLPISIWGVAVYAQQPFQPLAYISWENVHLDFSRVEENPSD
jgi:hypothetical protein